MEQEHFVAANANMRTPKAWPCCYWNYVNGALEFLVSFAWSRRERVARRIILVWQTIVWHWKQIFVGWFTVKRMPKLWMEDSWNEIRAWQGVWTRTNLDHQSGRSIKLIDIATRKKSGRTFPWEKVIYYSMRRNSEFDSVLTFGRKESFRKG